MRRLPMRVHPHSLEPAVAGYVPRGMPRRCLQSWLTKTLKALRENNFRINFGRALPCWPESRLFAQATPPCLCFVRHTTCATTTPSTELR